MSREIKPDVIIIGAGIVGLWTAVRAVEVGLSIRILDATDGKTAASHGVIGALMPHQPTDWNDKKQLQFDGLSRMVEELAVIECATGLSAGYARAGRLMPIRSEAELERHKRWSTGAASLWREHWTGKGPAPRWQVLDAVPDDTIIDAAAAPFGCALEALTAHVAPRRVIELLRAYLKQHGVPIERADVAGLHADVSVQLTDRSRISAGHVLVTAGHQSFDLIAPFTDRTLGSGVKGQAALLVGDWSLPDHPLVFDQGLYVVPHLDGTIAVGSTSENAFDDGQTTDGQLDDIIVTAQTLCPILKRGRVAERWAGVRAKANSRNPVVGPLPDAQRVILASGGFKITFALAPMMADAAIAHVLGGDTSGWPEAFTTQALIRGSG